MALPNQLPWSGGSAISTAMVTKNRTPMAAVMLRLFPAIAVLLFVALWASTPAAGQLITLKIEDCGGLKGGIVPGGVFNCQVTVEPKDASATVFGYSRATEAMQPQEVTGSGELSFKVHASMAPGRYDLNVFVINRRTKTADFATEMSVLVVAASSPSAKPDFGW